MGNRFSIATAGGADADYNLKLIMSVLPLVGKLSEKLAGEISKRDIRYDYLANVRTSAGILMTYLKDIEDDGESQSFGSQLKQLADCLEEMFSRRVIEISGLNVSKYPRLHAVQKIASKSDSWKPNTSHYFDVRTLEDPALWDKLRSNLESLTDELQSYGDDVDEVEEANFPIAPREPEKEMYDFINRALGAVLCKCQVKSNRDLMLLIGTYRNGKSKPIPECLCVLTSRDGSFRQWHELLIHDQSKRQRKAKASNSGISRSDIGCGPCVCDYLEAHTRPDFLRLDIDLHDDFLHPSILTPDKCIFDSGAVHEQIDLKRLLAFEDKPWTEPSKWALAVILAYSLLYLYNLPSVRWRWGRENIFFFKYNTHISLQPLLRTSRPQNREHTTDVPVTFHRHPVILELGVVLLEIHLGQRLQFFLKDDRDNTDPNDFYWSAWEVYKKQEHQIISLAYRNAIKACLSPATFAMSENDVQELRSVLFKSVVQPLEEELMRNFQEQLDLNDLDRETAEKCNLPLSTSPNHQSSYGGSNVQCQLDDPLPQLQAANDAQALRWQQADARFGERLLGREMRGYNIVSRKSGVRWVDQSTTGEFDELAEVIPSEKRRGAIIGPRAMLFDTRNQERDERVISDWRKWLNDFKSFRRQILPDAVDPDTQQRVRVTIIDTGIDASHPYIRSKRWTSEDENVDEPLFCDFVEPESVRDKHDPIDEDGHGTFIAGILLQIAPDIELSVARIGMTRKSIQDDPQVDKKISLAIKHAINTWQTDIISMSFGSEEISYDIRDAIDEALNHNIILLAAAGNSGNRRHVPYPANEDGVFKIFATNTSGYTTEFSPPTDGSDSQYSYFTLGSGVVSTWPLSLRERAEADGLDMFCHDSRNGHVHSEDGCDFRAVMSGTSFATPIAAALVAIIYQFYDANESLDSRVLLRKESRGRFKTPKAVRAILLKMSRRSSQAKYNFLEPARGRDDYFYFRPHRHPELDNALLNIDRQTPIQFFSKKLSEALYTANI